MLMPISYFADEYARSSVFGLEISFVGQLVS